ncbi:GYD domain-containing protein [Robiginitalea aurantiaca]|uniref:GYD domain-containing protein n=1 Tax=Robiginitalea aurantiaca TaxID=3056915 RepID=A0ABT7WFL3_9FLAO|nr:GYD domain-containing protein [Robiginitalea aurantiaca]MDM9631709.1 GYD domain-containing protein [Robiginitalea aurantiaca]
MFIGEPNAAAWKVMMDDPGDRKEAVSAAFEKIGGKIISYYFGLGDGKNYIICELPNDNELIQAVYVMRLPTGLLASYHIIELMPSDQMSKALVKSKELLEIEKQTGGGVPKGN